MEKFFSRIIFLGLIMAFVLGGNTFARADVLKEIMDRGELVIGVQTQGPPISFIDKDNKRTGLAVELVRILAKDMGVKLVLKEYEWKGLIPALLSKKVDFLACDMTPTVKRSTALNFTDPYMFSDLVAFKAKGKPFKSWEDLNKPGVSVAAIQGSNHVAIIKRLLPKATLKEYAGGGAAVATAVMAGRVDAGVNGFSVVRGYMKDFKDMRLMDGILYHGPVSWPVRPEDTHLLHMLNNFIHLAEADGRLKVLVDYWWTTNAWEKDHK